MMIQSIRTDQVATVDKGIKKSGVLKSSSIKKYTDKNIVVLSKEGKNILKNSTAMDDRAKKIDDLKKKIALGDYTVDSYDLAKKILKSMRGD